MKSIPYLLCLVLGLYMFPATAQIRFADGDFSAALKQAKAEKKIVFVDFWAEWCGPCKRMTSEIFSLPEVGEYFNTRFVCIKVDTDVPVNKELVDKYKVTSLPTMAFIAADGKELRRVIGSVPAQTLIHEAQIVTGEALSFEQLYEKYRKNKKDFEAAQQLLIEASGFMATQSGINLEKWGARIDMLFSEYLKNKQLKHMINPEDFFILTMYHGQLEKNDPVFDFVVAHYDDYIKIVDKETVNHYIIGLNNSAIIQLCKKGDREGYEKRIQQMDGNLEKVYAGVKFGTLPIKEVITLLADGTYYLYKGEENQYLKNMDAYFAALGDSVTVDDYTQPLEDLYRVSQGKLSELAQKKAIVWLTKALQKEMGPEVRTRLLIMLGDCYAGTGEREKAKQSYNQASLNSARITDPELLAKMQRIIQHKLQIL